VNSSSCEMKRVALCVTIWWALLMSGHAEAVPASCPTNLSTGAPATGGSVGGNNVLINVSTNPPPPGLAAPPSTEPVPGKTGAEVTPLSTEPEPGTAGAGGAPGGYDPTKDPGMGGEPPNIPGAGQQPFTGGVPAGGPTSGATGGQVVEQPGLKPPPPGPGGTGTPGQPPQQGIVCYSEMTKEYFTIPYGPCPPPHMKPPTGATAGGEPGRTPWQGLIPPEGSPPMGPKPPMGKPPMAKPPMGPKPPPGGGGCGPATSCTCAGGGMGHIPCDKSKGACHCGGG